MKFASLLRPITLPLIFALAVVSAAQNYQPLASGPDHLKQADKIAIDLRNQAKKGQIEVNGVKLNQYGASWSLGWLTQADPVNGVLATQNNVCSNFVTRILGQAYGWDWKSYTFEGKKSVSPSAKLYQDYIENGIGFNRVTSVLNAAPGDIIAVEYKDGSSNSGHVMILRKVIGYGTFDGNRLYNVEVIDCSSGAHSDDSRILPDNTVTQGAGIGVICILTNQVGEILGYTWSKPTGETKEAKKKSLEKKLVLPAQRELMIGRLILN